MLEKLFTITAYANPATPEATAVIEQTAEAVSNEAISPMTVFGFGFGLVFIGLIAIIMICNIMGYICRLFIKDNKGTAQASKAQSSKKSQASAKVDIPNKGEFVAAVSAALAEEMGKDVSAIRILSIKKL